ncbi:50S ribosomal protein L11 methyltransferase [Candidatus Campbellbacteria bacterium]|nr:MAG: 50S ribosomal protein L11 methyltransferase [Candidatus Campbellbacteria bacterium]
MITEKKNEKYWSMTEGVFNCLIDSKRTLAFGKAIKNTVKPGDVVVDTGAGSGVLAMLAADAGARIVYAIEVDKKNSDFLQKTFEMNGYDKKIKLIKGDATKVDLPEKVDFIMCEMIATGLIEELQIPAMNNILRFAKKKTKVLLEKYDNYVDLVFNKNFFYGHEFPIVRYEYADLKNLKSKVLTKKYRYSTTNLSRINTNSIVDTSMSIKITHPGLLNAIRISSESMFCDKTKFWDSFAYSYPILLPVDAQNVKQGDVLKLNLKYEMCGGFKTLSYSLVKK